MSEVFLPSDLIAGFGGVAKFRRVHQLQVLFVLAVGACGDFIQPLAQVAAGCSAKLCKGAEKLIVSGDSGRRDEAAHGERVDQVVVEVLVLENIRGGNSANSAGRRLLPIAGRENRLCSLDRRGLDAQAVFCGGANPGFRVHGAAQMIVQISAFRHFEKQVAQIEGIRAYGFERN